MREAIEGLLRGVKERSNSGLMSMGECSENGEFGELPEGDKGGVPPWVPSMCQLPREIGLDIKRKRTDSSLNIKEPGGGPSHQVHLLCRKKRSTCSGLEASPTNTGHTCFTADLGIRF